MSVALLLLIVLLLVVLTMASYVERLYGEMGRFLSREFQENIEVWEEGVEPRLGFSRDHLALSSAVIAQLSLGALAILLAILLFDRAGRPTHPTAPEIAQALLSVLLATVVCNRLLPYMFFSRTRGRWLLHAVVPLRLMFALFLPFTLVVSFLISIASLASPPDTESKEESTGAAVDALIEAGQEEGILEEHDHALIRSAVEFGDKIVREVMTPRPRIFAVASETTVEQLLALLDANPFSRVPVFSGELDNIAGIAFTHDILQITDVEAHTQPIGSIARPATYIPEMKRANEALREMQREKQHMRIVIDEYGGVSGLVTIEDLLEEIVGTIADEHEGEDIEAVREERAGVWSVPGELEIAQLENLLGDEWAAPGDMEATTVAGLVSETAGRIPMRGEVIEQGGLRFEVLASTDRRIDRLRISRIGESAAA